MDCAQGLARGLFTVASLTALCLAWDYGDSVCAGKTPEGFTAWVNYDPKSIYVDVDTSACGFVSTPIYVTSLAGNAELGRSTGGSEIYTPTLAGFRMFLRYDYEVTDVEANQWGWHVHWLADPLGSSAPARGVCSGQTLSTNWSYYAENAIGTNVDTSACGFGWTPIYVSTMVGDHSHYFATGSSELYSPSATGFDINVYHRNGLTAADAQSRNYYINWLADDAVCSGQTPSGSTDWQEELDVVYVDVNTSGCWFQYTPVYITSMSGFGHYRSTGSSEVYLPTPTGFRTYIYLAGITAAVANSQAWQVNWIARPWFGTACTAGDGTAMSASYPCVCGTVVCEEPQLCLEPIEWCQACPAGYELTHVGCRYPLHQNVSLEAGACVQVLGHAVKTNASASAKGFVYVLTLTLGAPAEQFLEALELASATPSVESLQSSCTEGWAVMPGSAEIELTQGALEGPCTFITHGSEGKIVRESGINVHANLTNESGLERGEMRGTVDVFLEFDAAAVGVLRVGVSSTAYSGYESLDGGSFSSVIDLHPEEDQVMGQPHTLTIGDLHHVQTHLSQYLTLEVTMIYLAIEEGGSNSTALVQNITDQALLGLTGESGEQFTFVPGVASFASCSVQAWF